MIDHAITGYLTPDQVRSLTFKDFPGGTIDEVADRLYRNEPTFMSELQADIAAHGVHERVKLNRWADRLEEGHHRVAAAYRAGQPIPFTRGGGFRFVDEDEQRKWMMRRRELPEEYEARMAHDPARWREQENLPPSSAQTACLEFPVAAPGRPAGVRRHGRTASSRMPQRGKAPGP